MLSPESVRDLTARLRTAFPQAATVRVLPDPYQGARVRIIAEEFDQRSPAERRSLVLEQVPDDEVAHLELLTPAEAEFFDVGSEDEQPELSDLPLWPEAMAHGEARLDADAAPLVVHLPSLEFKPLAAPMVATFYSLRGGVGRSTALAHAARILADQGLRVLCIDLDLEAPGLASLFGVEDQIVAGRGVVTLLVQAEITGEPPDLADHLLRITADGDLHLLPAGLLNADYARQLALLDPAAWYREDVNPLRLLIDGVQALARPPQIVLIDSRTGISPLAAPLLFDIADLAIVVFYPHPQSRLGTAALTRALLTANTRRSTTEAPMTPEVRFVVSPVPAARELRQIYAQRAESWVGKWLEPARTPSGEPAFPSVDELIQVVSYQEGIATTDSAMAGPPVADYETIGAWVAGLVESEGEGLGDSAGEPSKSEVLAALHFTSETAEQQGRVDLDETFLTTDAVTRALSPDVTLVIGRKGTGKTAIFRRLAEDPSAIIVTSPSGAETHRAWMPDANVYASVEREFEQRGLSWRQAWPAIIGLAAMLQRPSLEPPTWPQAPLRAGVTRGVDYQGTDLLHDLRAMFGDQDSPLLIAEWLRRVDQSLEGRHQLLFDALDTGFGNTEADRLRRRSSVAGLLTAASELSTQWRHLRLKILLREDIWRDVSFPNKSHLGGSTARLSWSDKTDYLRLAIKQAWRARPFRNLIAGRLDREGFNVESTAIDYWPDSFVSKAWVILAGERVSGGRTAFTDNWIWVRLADANGDHSPRTLVQLLAAATERERRFEPGNPYARSILRPRALVESLDDVSIHAVDALSRDEFPELEPLLDELKTVGTTPFDADQLKSSQVVTLIPLGREVGLLEPAVDPRTGAERFRVPELYRKALGMNRRGQA
jgi:MinD-like ATPase involved in chromosome partitioning or flagellar assembly